MSGFEASRGNVSELTVAKTAGVLTVSGGGTTITPHANGGNAVSLTQNVRSGQVSITCADVDLTASGGEAIAVTIVSNKFTTSDVLVASMGLAGAGAGDDTFINLAVSANMNAEAAYAYFWISCTYGTYDMGAGSGANVLLLNWAVL
jgi:hypothetical protein